MVIDTAKLIASRPVLLDELIRIARSRRVHLFRILYLLAFLSGAIMVSQGVAVNPHGGYSGEVEAQVARMGKALFYCYVVCQSIGLGIVAPALTAGVIAREKENRTFELLLTTDLGPSEILWHRVISHILALTLLTAAAVPVFFLCMFFGGVSAGDILAFLGFIAGFLLLCCGAAALFSSLLRTTAGSVLASYGFIWGIMGIAPIFLGILCKAVDLCDEEDIFKVFAHLNIVWCYFAFAVGEMPRSVPYEAWASSGLLTGLFFLLAMSLSSRLAPRSIEWPSRRIFTRVMSALDRFYGSFRLGKIELLRARAPIRDNPILWRECHTNVFGRRAYFIRIVLVVYILGGCLTLMEPGIFIDDDAQRGVLCLEYIALGLILVVCGSGTIAKERQSRTLGLLLTTPIEPRNILLGKMAGVLWRAFLVFLLIAVHILLLDYLDMLTRWECVYCLANAFVFGAFFLAVAMASSAYWKTASRATLGALLISFGILAAPAMVALLLNVGPWSVVLDDFAEFFLGFSPGYWIVAMLERYNKPELVWYIAALALYGAAAFILFRLCGRRFRKLAEEA
ncbi:MAG: ABC transporter permease subunit [Planctomycetota bacterium]